MNDTTTHEPKPPRTTARRTGTAIATVRDTGKDVLTEAAAKARHAGEIAEANPLAIVAGGIAIGAVVGALLPRTAKEADLLGPVGRRITDVAAGAAGAARTAAAAELASLPLTKSAARDQIGKLIGQVVTALASAGEAAVDHAKDARTTKPAK